VGSPNWSRTETSTSLMGLMNHWLVTETHREGVGDFYSHA
jgi:hypothetical protein